MQWVVLHALSPLPLFFPARGFAPSFCRAGEFGRVQGEIGDTDSRAAWQLKAPQSVVTQICLLFNPREFRQNFDIVSALLLVQLPFGLSWSVLVCLLHPELDRVVEVVVVGLVGQAFYEVGVVIKSFRFDHKIKTEYIHNGQTCIVSGVSNCHF